LAIESGATSAANERRDRDGFRPDIEGLRGLAIALVVLYHAGLPLSGGFIGVDVFFVISGFLITGVLLRDRERHGAIRIGRFYARRARRLLPAAAVVALVTILAADRLVSPLDRPSVSLDGAAAALSVANIRFALTVDYFSPIGSPSPFLHFWSLGVEEQFYIVWPALLALAAAWRPRLGAGVVLGAVLLASLAASVLVTDQSPSAAFYLLPTRAWQLAAGGLLAVGVGAPFDRAPRLVLAGGRVVLGLAAWGGLGVIAGSALILDSGVAYPGLIAVIPTGAAVLLLAGGGQPFGPGALLRMMPLRFVGRISYSLYLWHWPVLVLGGLAIGGTLGLDQSIGLVSVAVLLAVATWALVEEPFRQGRIPMPARPRQTVAIGVAVMLVVALIGSAFDFSDEAALASLGGPVDVAAAEPSPAVDIGPPPDPTMEAPTNTGPTTIADPSKLPDMPVHLTNPAPTPTPVGRSLPGPRPAPPTSYRLTAAVRPSLAGARADYERPWLDGCLGSLSTTTPHDCLYANRTGSFTVALVGDSHASALFPAVEAVAIAHGWRLLTFVKVACPLLDMPLYNAMLKREYTECATWNANVIARLNAVHPDLVLVSNSRWVFPFQAADRSRAREGAALARMIGQIPSHVAIIVDVPLPYNDVPECLAAHAADVRQCAVPRWQALGYDMGVIERTAASKTRADLIDLTAGICPGSGACPVVINDMIAYRDGHHLTATFSRTLAPLLDQRLRALGIM
jgi:peptidoglycan/LPS O-acetylase OafA/YrhL